MQLQGSSSTKVAGLTLQNRVRNSGIELGAASRGVYSQGFVHLVRMPFQGDSVDLSHWDEDLLEKLCLS